MLHFSVLAAETRESKVEKESYSLVSYLSRIAFSVKRKYFLVEKMPLRMVAPLRLRRRRAITILAVILGIVLVISLRVLFLFLRVMYFDWEAITLNEDKIFEAPNEHLIPPILHQTYHNKTPIPHHWQEAQKSCLSKHQHFQYMFWTDETARAFIAKQFPEYLANFDSYPYNIQRVDAMRYFILYHYGGIYLDMDVGCRQSLDPLRRFPAILPRTDPFGLSNDVMMAAPNHALFENMILELSRWNWRYGTRYPTVMFSTGPMFVDTITMNTIERRKGRGGSEEGKQRDEVFVLPGQLYGNQPTSYFYHVHGSSWHGDDSAVILWIGQHVGATVIVGCLLIGVGVGLVYKLIKSSR
jgi:mannosyltransferase OCH1-like enzyme